MRTWWISFFSYYLLQKSLLATVIWNFQIFWNSQYQQPDFYAVFIYLLILHLFIYSFLYSFINSFLFYRLIYLRNLFLLSFSFLLFSIFLLFLSKRSNKKVSHAIWRSTCISISKKRFTFVYLYLFYYFVILLYLLSTLF